MRAIVLDALGVEVQGVILNGEAALLGNRILALFNFRIVKLLNSSALDANQMVVVLAVIDLENCLARLKKMPLQQAGLLELGEHAVNRGQADVHVFGNKHPVHIFGRHVAKRTFLKKLKNFQARKGGFQADILEALGVAHRKNSRSS